MALVYLIRLRNKGEIVREREKGVTIPLVSFNPPNWSLFNHIQDLLIIQII